jgi:branched-chain amino acid aminotransferase
VRARGADDGIILNLAGEVTEASVSNIAFVRDGKIVTPPLSAGILEGITRSLVIRGVAESAGLQVSEETIRPSDLPAMQECFLLSTTKDIVPVGKVDEISYKVGPGTVASRLKASFASFAALYSKAHPELFL